MDNPGTPHDDTDVTKAPPPSARGLSVPATLWIWLAVLVLSYGAPYLGGPKRVAEEVVKESGLTTKTFQTLLQAELTSRFYLLYQTGAVRGALASSVRTRPGAAPAADPAAPFAQQAETAYRKVATEGKGPNAARKLLILNGMQKKPFDDDFVAKTLVPNLRNAGIADGEVRAEADLWRALYAKQEPPPRDVAIATARLQAMRLSLYEDVALRDLYARAGQAENAAEAERRFDRRAISQGLRLGASLLFQFAIGLTGLVALVFFLVAWRTGKWHLVARVPTLPQSLTWGDLLDTFVFYLAISRGVGLALSLADPQDRLPIVPVIALSQAGTGLLAIGYGAWRARRRGATLAGIGVRTNGLFGDVLYGVAGYGAALPVLLVLSQINQYLFRNNTSATPNPVLPLLAGEQDATLRFVIFLLVAVGAPLFEEFFFRGVLFSALRTRFAWVGSAVISGALFAVMHPPSDWLPIFGLGFVLATLREMRQSIVPGIVAHFLQNFMAYFLMSTLFSG